MFTLNEQLAIYKFALINRFLNCKGKDLSYLKELQEKFALLNKLMERAKTDKTIECTEEIAEIKAFIAKKR